MMLVYKQYVRPGILLTIRYVLTDHWSSVKILPDGAVIQLSVKLTADYPLLPTLATIWSYPGLTWNSKQIFKHFIHKLWKISFQGFFSALMEIFFANVLSLKLNM